MDNEFFFNSGYYPDMMDQALRNQMEELVQENTQLRINLAAKANESDQHAAAFKTADGVLKNKVGPAFEYVRQRAQYMKSLNAKLMDALRDRDTVPRRTYDAACEQLRDVQRRLGQKTRECEQLKASAQQPSQFNPLLFAPELDQFAESQVWTPMSTPMSITPSNLPTTALRRAPNFVQARKRNNTQKQASITAQQQPIQVLEPIDLTNDEPAMAGEYPSHGVASVDFHAAAERGATSTPSVDTNTAALDNSQEIPHASTAQTKGATQTIVANPLKRKADSIVDLVNGNNPNEKPPPYRWCQAKSGLQADGAMQE